MILLDPSTLLIAALVTIVAAVVQASIGSGFGMIAAPVLFLLSPDLVPGVIITLAGIVTGLTAWHEIPDINRPATVTALAGRLPGALLAGWLISVMPVNAFTGLFGVMIILAVVFNIAGIVVRPTSPVIFGAGFASGVMGTVTSVGAPPLALIFQAFGGAGMRATMSATLLVGALISISALVLFGAYGLRDLLTALVLAPAAVVGFLISRPLALWLDRTYWRPAVYAVSAAAAVLCVVQAFNGL